MFQSEHQRLCEWVAAASANGIKQGASEWHNARQLTIGGSSMATICGCNPYASLQTLVSEKIGRSFFKTDIKPQWGNLFEDVIKRYVEVDLRCEILGEDLFIEGPPGTAYSPDGLTILPHKGVATPTLVEFKCPFSRIPTGKAVPKYYMPQLLMGLDILGGGPEMCKHGPIASRALFAEAVFRRCTWEQVGPSSDYDRTLVTRAVTGAKSIPLAFGINGFYCPAGGPQPSAKLVTDYLEYYVELGDASNGFQSADLGDAPVKLFTDIMSAYDQKILRPWYGPVHIPKRDSKSHVDKTAHIETLQADLDAFDAFCAEHGHTNWGILPWKLLRIDYNYVERVPGYLEPYLPKIREVLGIVAECLANPDLRENIYDSYFRSTVGGFSD